MQVEVPDICEDVHKELSPNRYPFYYPSVAIDFHFQVAKIILQ